MTARPAPGGGPDPAEGSSPTARDARRAAFAHLSRLLEFAPTPRWATAVLVALGLASAFAEALGIALVVLLVYSLLGQVDEAILNAGLVGRALRWVTGRFDSTAPLAAFILLLIFGRCALAFANLLISASVSEGISERIRNLLHEQYLAVSYRFVQRHEQAQLMEVLGTESWLVAGAYASRNQVIVSGLSVLVVSVFLVALSWQITLTAVVGSVLLSLGLRRLSGPARELGRRVKWVHQELAEHMLMTLEGLRTIRAYGQEEAHHRRFVHSSAEARRTSIALTRLASSLDPLTEFGYLGILCAILASSELLGVGFAVTLTAVALLYRMQPHARAIEGNLLYLAQIEPQLRSLWAMLRQDDKAYPAAGTRPLEALHRSVRFERVTFRYEPDARPALREASFEIPFGVTTAISGASGAGKTTIINLLLRLYEPSAGTIWVDDVPLHEVRRADWLRRVAVAGQDVDLIEGTVIDNIRMADSRATDEEVIAASQIAGVTEFIDSLPEGYRTWVGQQGARFSVGQRQRIGLARAILRDPEFLMLDEAMSALDPELESRIRRALGERFAGRTIVVITHRRETVLDVDHRVHIENGTVVDAPARTQPARGLRS